LSWAVPTIHGISASLWDAHGVQHLHGADIHGELQTCAATYFSKYQPDAERCGPSWESHIRSLHEDAEAAQEGREEAQDSRVAVQVFHQKQGAARGERVEEVLWSLHMEVRVEEVLFFITSHAPSTADTVTKP
jgi:hypothetical protein